jgi:hypothetical protein
MEGMGTCGVATAKRDEVVKWYYSRPTYLILPRTAAQKRLSASPRDRIPV